MIIFVLILVTVIVVLMLYILKTKNKELKFNNVSNVTSEQEHKELNFNNDFNIISEQEDKKIDFLLLEEDEEDDDFATVVIEANKNKQEKVVKLINESNGSMEIIRVGNKEYTIGRLNKEVDFYINDKTISRKHAVLLCHENKLYVRDLDSKNKVYINNREIEPGKFFEIKNNYSIKFGNIEYTFEIDE